VRVKLLNSLGSYVVMKAKNIEPPMIAINPKEKLCFIMFEYF